jgi:phosphohistidine swiveling domain-containing protein
MKSYILPLSDPQATLETVGGKGMSLAKLTNAGLPVPDGFHITTKAYIQFVNENNLQNGILEALQQADVTQPASLEKVSTDIRRLFDEALIPGELANAIVSAYGELPGSDPAVAVRSSATAEDLPEASFAGQQDTFLNITRADRVLEAVKKCWSSLWTARAIGYRARQNISPENVALAVVVQLFVNAEAAGILFTANPLNNKRDQAIINAAWGLGEAVVGGAVTPDTLAVDKNTGSLIQRETAEKQVMTVRTEWGTQEQPVPDSLKRVPVLSNDQAVQLARCGMQIEELYGMPMDIEWTLSDGKFAIVQARPITSLGEAPLEWKMPHPKGIYMRTSVVDLMPDPLSPLFATLGIQSLVNQMYPLGKYLTRLEPVLPEGYFTTINNYAYMNAHFSGRAWIWILFGLLPSYPRMLRMLVPFWRDEARPQYQKVVTEMESKDIEKMSNTELWARTQTVMEATGYYTGALLFATMGASAGSEGLLTKVYEKMAQRPGDPPANVLLMGWDNIPIRSEKSLYDLAMFRKENALGAYVLQTPSSELAGWLKSGSIPEGIDPENWQEFRQRFNQHLQEFGHMVFDLDFAKPLPLDHPEPMLEVIKMYLRGEGTNPHERQQASQERRIQTMQEVQGRLKGFKRWAFTTALNWAQSLSEVREDAIAEIGIGYPIIRNMLHNLGEHLVKEGVLHAPEDIYWLEKDDVDNTLAELEASATPKCMFTVVEKRKAFWQKAKQAAPPPMLPPKKKYMGINTTVWLAEAEGDQGGRSLKGVPTSAGKVTAAACVLHGPEDFAQMRPGDVLVAGTTTPAWTPLFAMASAVVTDIGGPLSHGSIVAREYGIPAVMGTGVATRRIKDGQMVTVDGNAGTVTLL